jgi:hypothetical protein
MNDKRLFIALDHSRPGKCYYGTSVGCIFCARPDESLGMSVEFCRYIYTYKSRTNKNKKPGFIISIEKLREEGPGLLA